MLNRKDRRKNKIKDKPIVLTVHEEEIASVMKEVKEESVKQSVKLVSAAFLRALHNEYDFGAVRLNKIIKRTQSQMECIKMGTLEEDELYAWCESMKIKL